MCANFFFVILLLSTIFFEKMKYNVVFQYLNIIFNFHHILITAMNEHEIKQFYNQVDKAKKEYAGIIISGLSDNDLKEVNFACQLIKDELIPALELDKSLSKEYSLKTLNTFTAYPFGSS